MGSYNKIEVDSRLWAAEDRGQYSVSVKLLSFIFFCLFLSPSIFSPTASAQINLDYTKDDPLIIASDWDFPPYEYSNDEGEPAGYNIELLQTIFKKLDIPYRIILREWSEATQTFERRDADLIIDPTYRFHGRPYIRSTNILNYYKVQLVTAADARKVTALDDFTPEDTLVLKLNDYAANRIVDERHLDIPIIYRSPKEALAGISEGRYKYFIWGEGPLKWKKKELAMDTMFVNPIDIPDGEIRIVGYDKELIDAIDDEYARLEQSGDLEALRDKWFHPERQHDDTSPMALIVLAGAIIAVVIGVLMARLVRARVRQAVHKTEDLNNMMEQALNMGKYYVFTIDVTTGRIHNIHGDLLPEGEMVREVFMPRIKHDDQDDFQKKVDLLVSGELQQARYTKQLNIGTRKDPNWIWLSGLASLEYVDFKPRYITNTVRDITQQVEDERVNSELSAKYMQVFKTNIVAMSFYDKDGNLIDLNDNMRKLCGITEETKAWFHKTQLFEAGLFKDQYLRNSRHQFHACQHTYIPELGLNKYLEVRINPIIDDRDEVKYYVVTCREVTAERDIYLEQLRHNQEMEKTNAAINDYEQRLQYLLEKSDMFVWKFDLVTRQIHFSRSLRTEGYTMSRDEYVNNMFEDEREMADRNILGMIQRGEDFNAIHHFYYLPSNPDECWSALSGVPEYNKDGKMTAYFGVARDVTALMQAQQRLKLETSRAEDSGRMKSAFLANMTHEIRTPLNAIVGFSDLLPVIDTKEERMEFIRIIRNNCDMLMRLINDILEASSMGQALAIKPTEVDISPVFDDICQTLAQRVQEPGVEFIKDNPYPTCPTVLDKGRVQQVLTNFVTNAVKYTHQGFIKVGYHWDRRMKFDGSGEADGLTFYCLDTGAGIPKDKQASVFERFVKLNDFVQGTGLGLSICQNIVERCNGHIGVTSEGEGHGSSFWFWIPCERKVISLPCYDNSNSKA